MQELLKQVNADIAEVTKKIKVLRSRRTRAKTTSKYYNIDREILGFEAMLSDLRSTKAEIEDYIKTRSEDNA